MQELLRNAKIRTLLRQAEDAHRLLHSLDHHSAARRDVDATLHGIFHDLGQSVHSHWRALLEGGAISGDTAETEEMIDVLLPRPEQEVASEAEEPGLPRDEHTEIPDPTNAPAEDEGGSGQWYTEEVEWDRQQQPLFAPGELDEGAEPEEVTGPTSERGVLPLAEAEPHSVTRGVGPAVEVLELLSSPADESTEAARIQWAAAQIERCGGQSTGVQLAIAAVVAARARHLIDQTDHAVAGRAAIERVRRWHRNARLPMIAALEASLAPETGTWLEDARQWRATLKVE